MHQITQYLDYKHVFFWRNNTGRRGRVSYGKKGSSDYIGIYRGLFLAIEVKKQGGGKLSEDQVKFLNRVRAEGGIAIEARSVEDVRDGLREADMRLRAHARLKQTYKPISMRPAEELLPSDEMDPIN